MCHPDTQIQQTLACATSCLLPVIVTLPFDPGTCIFSLEQDTLAPVVLVINFRLSPPRPADSYTKPETVAEFMCRFSLEANLSYNVKQSFPAWYSLTVLPLEGMIDQAAAINDSLSDECSRNQRIWMSFKTEVRLIQWLYKLQKKKKSQKLSWDLNEDGKIAQT